ncbi:MAG: ZIP family metal transporter [Firmicutes bacterium]|jgi:ZIP family zinc transporter|nr:ZIP family metal transporter [Bacillota bacterium]
MDWLEITLIGLMAGTMGTGIGGLLALSLFKPSNNVLGLMLGFSGGIMLSIVFMELLQKAAENSFAHMIVGLLLGILVFVYLDNYFPHWHYVSEETVGKAYVRKGVLIATGIALHNLPEGIAIGAGFASSEQMGITLAILIAAHNIPEGMAVGFPLYFGGLGRVKSLAITLMAGVPMGAGALLGALAGNISFSFLSLSLGFAAGAMLYIVCDELIPDVYRLASAHTAILGITAGILTGMLMVYYL